ncbi:MAG: D-alanyl-D-alanine carboxypeptidase [Deltaproteobacteria bacterium]|nr:D-alanyl-D-alanine carboxypeptidase [Deltaproteobacteria bacterium]
MISRLWRFLVPALLLAAAPLARSASLPPDLASLLGPRDSLLVTDAAGRRLISWNADRPRIPASVLKLLTAHVALTHLGPGYRFTTDFFQDEEGCLYARGHGDPLLVSEVLADLARDLAPRLAPVSELVVDGSDFARPLTIPGVSDSANPYDAPNGALCANFNTVSVRRCAAGRYVSAEPQTPLLPFARALLKQRPPADGRLVLTHDGGQAALYAGHLLAHFLAEAGQPVAGTVRRGMVPPEVPPVLVFASPFPLAEVVARMLEHSNNFIANQLLIAAGAKVHGLPGTLEKGVRLACDHARRNLGWENFQLVEGSGIARQNRVTAADLDRLLAAFAPHRHLLPSHGRARYKTGTLSGIQTRAGYIEGPSGALYRFVVLINTPGRRADPVLAALRQRLP